MSIDAPRMAPLGLVPVIAVMWAGSQDAPAATSNTSVVTRHPWIFFTGYAWQPLLGLGGAR